MISVLSANIYTGKPGQSRQLPSLWQHCSCWRPHPCIKRRARKLTDVSSYGDSSGWLLWQMYHFMETSPAGRPDRCIILWRLPRLVALTELTGYHLGSMSVSKFLILSDLKSCSRNYIFVTLYEVIDFSWREEDGKDKRPVWSSEKNFFLFVISVYIKNIVLSFLSVHDFMIILHVCNKFLLFLQ